MTNTELTDYLCRATKGVPRRELIARLAEWGVLSVRGCEQQAICAEVERLVRQGAGRCEAMEAAAQRFCCSYAKVRQAVYYKRKG